MEQSRWPAAWPLQPIPREQWARQSPTWRAAKPGIIEGALKRALARPTGNWYVLAASRDVGTDEPFGVNVAGVELVAWRGTDHALHVGPGACPHLGAPLARGRVDCGALYCRWHGLALSGEDKYGWSPYPAYDDGVLAWVRLDQVGGEDPTLTPNVPLRPHRQESIEAVTTVLGICEPEDVIANRLDPWHGSWFHPYSFAHLAVVSTPDERTSDDPEQDKFVVRVTFRATKRLGVPVLAEFTCPGPRTIIMRITSGEGAGSVVETHATPLAAGADGKPRTAIIEATVAASPRTGFVHARKVAAAIRPMMRYTANRLWKDDLAYAERRYELRSTGRWLS